MVQKKNQKSWCLLTVKIYQNWLKNPFVTGHLASGPNVEMRPLCHRSHPRPNRSKWYSTLNLKDPVCHIFFDATTLHFTNKKTTPTKPPPPLRSSVYLATLGLISQVNQELTTITTKTLEKDKYHT